MFTGSFSLEAAETVGQSGSDLKADVIDVLANLVERSFVIREGTSGRARFRMHETMREFARLRLLEADEAAAARSAHLAYFSGLCRLAECDVAHADVASRLALAR